MMRSSRLGDRLDRLLLRVFPAETREAHGSDMVRQWCAEREARAGRPLALAGFWVRALADGLWHGLLDRLAIRSSITTSAWSHPMSTLRSSVAGPDTPRPSLMGGVTQDLTWSLRRLRASPGFTCVATLTLALGIGATSAIFSVVDGVLLKPLPYPESARMVGLFQVWEGKRDVFAAPNFLDLQARAKTLASAGAFSTHGVTLTQAGEPARVIDAEVTAGFFDVLATPPLLGRTLVRADNDLGHADVAVLGYGLWQSRFGADSRVVGRTLTLDGRARQIVGVMPRGFAWPFEAECWVPAEYDKNFTSQSRGAWNFGAIARLKPGVTLGRADTEVALIGRQLENEYPEMNAKLRMTAYPILDDMLGDTKRALLVLLGAVGFVLLIACVNVANLVLARAASREGELAVRVALGAGRWRLMRQVLVESLLLAALGGAAGLLLAFGGLRILQAVRPPDIPRLDNVGLDGTMLAFTFAVTVLTGFVFGLVPSLQTTGRSLADVLRERGRSALAGPRGRATRHALIVVEMALAVLLLTGAGLLIRSFSRLVHVNPGFSVGQALTFQLGLPDLSYTEDAARLAFFQNARTGIKALPGVTDVGLVLTVPPTPPEFTLSFAVTGRPPLPPAEQPTLEIRVADADYFHVMNIPVRRGRLFASTDRAGTTRVLVLTESAVRRYFPTEDPIGKHLVLGWRRNKQLVEGDVIGVVADVKSFGLDREAPPQLYLPLSQTPITSMAFVIRTAVAPEQLFAPVRAAVHQIDPNLPIAHLETLEAHVNATVAERRFYMLLLALFASIALVLAGVGIFGVLSYLVAQRTREIGIRMALGADRRSVVRLMLRQAGILGAAGILVGSACGAGLTSLMQTMLFELSPTDPLTFVLVDSSLLAIAILAAWVPTRRATRIDPTIALRSE